MLFTDQSTSPLKKVLKGSCRALPPLGAGVVVLTYRERDVLTLQTRRKERGGQGKAQSTAGT